MTRNEIIEQVNELLAGEFEVEVSDFEPRQSESGRHGSTAAGKLQSDYPRGRVTQDPVVQRPVRLH